MADDAGLIKISVGFDAEFAATGPLEFRYWVTPQVSVETKVYGTARDQATVCILSGSATLWCGSMTQAAPKVNAPSPLILGDTIVKKARFTLTIPTSIQFGQVFLSAKIKSADNPLTPFASIVAKWPLNSAVVERGALRQRTQPPV